MARLSLRETVALGCALALLLGAVSGSASPADLAPAAAGDRTLTIGHLFAIDSLNPLIGYSNEAYLFYALVYDFLFSLDEDQNYVPNIATGSSTPDGGRTWVYEIRQGVKWHDGTDLTPQDVAFTINYNIQNFWLLWAYEPYLNQVLQCEPGQTAGCGAVVTAPWEVTVYFERPFSPGGTAMVFPIMQEAQWESIDPYTAQYSYANENPIGTGPFKADSEIYQDFLRGDPLVLHANPDYHFGAPQVDRVIFQLFEDENSLVIALLNRDIDAAILSPVGYEAVQLRGNPNIEAQEGITVIQYWTDIGITQLNHPGINRRLNPARFDRNVRQAMAHATDKDWIVQQFYLGKAIPGSTLVSPIAPEWHYEPGEETLEFNLAEANALLDAAGYTDRDPDGVRKAAANITLDLYCSPQNLDRGCQTRVTIPKGQRLSFTMVTRAEAPNEKEIAQYLKQQWRDIGIELKGRGTPDPTVEEEIAMNTDVYGGEFDTYIWWWSGDADPNYILSVQSNFTLNGWSDNYFDNETYNNLYLAQLEAIDPVERRTYVYEALKVHYLDAPFIILAYPYFHYAWWTDEFEGWGDMVAHPGRQLGAFWGKHPLFLELRPKSGVGGSGGPDALLLGGAAAAVVAVVAVAAWVVRRRRKAEEAPPELPDMPSPPSG